MILVLFAIPHRKLSADRGSAGDAQIDNTMIKALARAFRWRRMLETGAVATIKEIATHEKINASYVSRVLRLTLLSPDIVEAILDGRQATGLGLPKLLAEFTVGWDGQHRALDN